MAVTADGDAVTVVTPEGGVRRVNIDIGAWTAIARKIANRSLTADERRQFLDGD